MFVRECMVTRKRGEDAILWLTRYGNTTEVALTAVTINCLLVRGVLIALLAYITPLAMGRA